MANEVLKIGITGGIGTGKTLISKIFTVLGIPVYDADSCARWISNFHPEVKRELIDLFGNEAYSGGKFNSRFIVGEIIKDKTKTEKLNAIVHPRVGEDFVEWIKKYQDFPYLLKEAALMYESDSYKLLDKNNCSFCPLRLAN